MSKFQEFLKTVGPELSALVESWYPGNSASYHGKMESVLRWLENSEFQKVKNGVPIYEDAFKILQEVKIIQEHEILAYTKNLSDGLTAFIKTHQIDTKKLILFSLGDTAAEGGSRFIKLFTERLALPKGKGPQISFEVCPIIENGLYVFIDDFVGSGKTIAKFIESHKEKIMEIKSRNSKLALLSMCCFDERLAQLNKDFDHVSTGLPLSSGYKIFSRQSTFLKDDPAGKARIKNWCRRIGARLYEHGPLGYNNNQTVIVFDNNTPNNSLPILWAGPKSESSGILANSWNAVFPRYKVSEKTPESNTTSLPKHKEVLVAKTKNFLNIISSSPDVSRYLESGNYTSAIKVILGAQSFSKISIAKQLEIIKIQQKAGFIEAEKENLGARENLDMLLRSKGFRNYPEDTRTKIKILDIKVSSQQGSFGSVIRNYSNVIKNIDSFLSHEEGLKCGIYHRAGVAFAIKGNKKRSKECFDKSLEISGRLNIRHSDATCKMYKSLCSAFKDKKLYEIENPILQLIECEMMYFDFPTDHKLWKYNGLKSSTQCLFGEAAIYLYNGEPEKGMLRLIAANEFAILFRGHPKSEGYAELLHLLPGDEYRQLINMAMSPDYKSKEELWDKIPESHIYLSGLKNILPNVVDNPSTKNWKAFRKILDKIDSSFGR